MKLVRLMAIVSNGPKTGLAIPLTTPLRQYSSEPGSLRIQGADFSSGLEAPILLTRLCFCCSAPAFLRGSKLDYGSAGNMFRLARAIMLVATELPASSPRNPLRNYDEELRPCSFTCGFVFSSFRADGSG